MPEAVIVNCLRTAVGKAPRGTLRTTRPDDMAAAVIQELLARTPELNPDEIDDVLIGCAMPEAEQGMNMGRVIALRSGLPDSVPGATVNRNVTIPQNNVNVHRNANVQRNVGVPRTMAGNTGVPRVMGGHVGMPRAMGGNVGMPRTMGGHVGMPRTMGGGMPAARPMMGAPAARAMGAPAARSAGGPGIRR